MDTRCPTTRCIIYAEKKENHAMNSDRTHNPINFYRTAPMGQMCWNRERESRKKIACSLIFMVIVCASMFRICPMSGIFMALFYLVGILAIVLPAVDGYFCKSA